ncbi:MAG: endonuclease III [Candidatus Saelkia tenebricola]|nr:endonuclease III [Candidatus Saelkia tenebricola]
MKSSANDRVEKIVKILDENYPQAHTSLFYKTPHQMLVATILSAQCRDEMVNKITPDLFKKYKNVRGFAKAKQAVLEKDIRSLGLYRNKAKNIIAASKKIVKDFDGSVPDTMENLVSLPGVARKTANIVLSSVFKKAEGIAVDTHLKRLSKRLALSKEDNPDKIERDLMKIVPYEYWLNFNYLLVNHGRKICHPGKPLCSECCIKQLCPFSVKFVYEKRSSVV